jgi:hypothetical protein
MDNRAQAIGIARLFLGLGVGAVVFWIVSAVSEPLFAIAGEQGSGQVATQGTTWLQQGVNFLPYMFALISFLGLIAYSVYRREVRR